MKKFICLLASILLTIVAWSQTSTDSTSYPRYYVVNGDTVGVIISLAQAQKIDNDLEIKKLLEQSLIDCDSLSNQYIVVMDQQQKRIALLEVKNTELLTATQQQTLIKSQLDAKIANYEHDLNLCDEQSKKKDIIISNQNSTINKLLWGGGALQLLLTGVIVLLIVK